MAFDDDRSPPRKTKTRHVKARRHDAGEQDAETSTPWPPAVLAVPVAVWRTTLFGAPDQDPSPRRYLSNQPILVRDGIAVRYTGLSLDRSDLHVWDVINHVGHLLHPDSGPGMQADQLLRLLGQTDQAAMEAAFSRMVQICIHIRHAQCDYRSGLINGITSYEGTQTRYWMTFNQAFATLLWRYAHQPTGKAVHERDMR